MLPRKRGGDIEDMGTRAYGKRTRQFKSATSRPRRSEREVLITGRHANKARPPSTRMGKWYRWPCSHLRVGGGLDVLMDALCGKTSRFVAKNEGRQIKCCSILRIEQCPAILDAR